MLRALVAEWPPYMAYLVSFATIGAVWFGHTAITEHLDHANSILIRLNLLLLLAFVSPIPNGLLAEYTREAKAERIAATVYGTNPLMTLILVSVVWHYAVHAQLVRPDMADEDVKTRTKRHTHVGRLRGDDHCGTVPTSSSRPRFASTIRVFFFDSAVCRPCRQHLTSKDRPEIADRQDETPALAGPADRTRWKGHPGETCSRWSGAGMRER
jgi:Endosomal/lysosomal potassium channel TMEM175